MQTLEVIVKFAPETQWQMLSFKEPSMIIFISQVVTYNNKGTIEKKPTKYTYYTGKVIINVQCNPTPHLTRLGRSG